MHDIYRAKTVSLAEYERAFCPVEGAVGMAVAMGGRLVGLDVFDQANTAKRLWNKLVRSYALDALDLSSCDAATEKVVTAFLDTLGNADAEIFPSLGLGKDLRLSGNKVEGSALVYQETVVHMVAFPAENGHSRQSSTGLARASMRRYQRLE